MIVSLPSPSAREGGARALHLSAFATQRARGTPPRITPAAPSHTLPRPLRGTIPRKHSAAEPPRARASEGRTVRAESSSRNALPRQDSSRVRHEVRQAASESLTKIPRRGAAGHDTDGKQEDATQRRERGLAPGSRCVLTRARAALSLVARFLAHAIGTRASPSGQVFIAAARLNPSVWPRPARFCRPITASAAPPRPS